MDTACMRWSGRHRKEDDRPMSGINYAYRVLWEEANGPIPPKMVLHHRCENSWCVNLSHLELLTQGDHLREHGIPGDWGQADKTHCPAGHPYDKDNTYTYVTKDGSTERHCRICRRAAKQRYNTRLKGGF